MSPSEIHRPGSDSLEPRPCPSRSWEARVGLRPEAQPGSECLRAACVSQGGTASTRLPPGCHGTVPLSTGHGGVKDSREDMGANLCVSPADGLGCSGQCLAFAVARV